MKPSNLGGKDVAAKPSMEDHLDGPNPETQPDKYQVEDSFNTLMKAEKIKKDPHMMKHVQKHAEDHGQALEAIKAQVTPEQKPAKSIKELRAIHSKNALAKRGMKP